MIVPKLEVICCPVGNALIDGVATTVPKPVVMANPVGLKVKLVNELALPKLVFI